MSGPGPFDPPGGADGDSRASTHRVLRNREGELSLWPLFAPPPEGWEVHAGPATYGRCVELLEASAGRPAPG
ncbi:MbtH-like protein [Streptomyces sp. Amel2xB2]|uniref:MbtH family NRPS accessory protein n=1 Tax=Streptomyces sp. Amel2xB2 TaxID=1305829 RepID=UPI000DB98D7F|nr:MbtH family NRPS accessory protein [Streptomyces sp. Amel2xB2]RAJ58987.1 MbtH-like protein [Streptomyces sp. Amel2xB2]